MTHETTPGAPHESAVDAPTPGVIAAIGAFDGLHRGHKILLGEMVERAAAIGARAVCVTFDPDPVQVLHPGAPPRNLCSTAEREQLIRAVGVDEVFVWAFTPQVAQMTPAEFVA